MEGSQSSPAQDLVQEFWLSLYDAANAPDTRTRDINLLRAWGIFHYALCGPTNCEQCQAPVRLAIPLTSELRGGELLRHACLCTNCTFEELQRAERIIMQVGRARVEYLRESVVSV